MSETTSNLRNERAALTVFYDGQCPLCRREIAALKRRDRDTNIAFIDISEPDFKPSDYGLTLNEFMSSIHALTADGNMLRGLAVFRAMYKAVGLGWVWGWTGLPGIKGAADICYRLFARLRKHLPGYPDCPKATCR